MHVTLRLWRRKTHFVFTTTEQQGITQTIHAQTEALKAKAQQINEQYKIGETASAWGTAAYGWWSGVDQALGLSQTATAIKQSSAAAARAVCPTLFLAPAYHSSYHVSQLLAPPPNALTDQRERGGPGCR